MINQKSKETVDNCKPVVLIYDRGIWKNETPASFIALQGHVAFPIVLNHCFIWECQFHYDVKSAVEHSITILFMRT